MLALLLMLTAAFGQPLDLDPTENQALSGVKNQDVEWSPCETHHYGATVAVEDVFSECHDTYLMLAATASLDPIA
ncbi:MAG: hypothetical protein AAF529_14180 [Pseudomonadota bacterium]